MKTRVFLGLGGNVGNRLGYLRAAARSIQGWPGVSRARASAVYETSPVGPRQRPFLNAALEMRTVLPPPVLLRKLKGLEKSLGRKPRKRWGPREIDLDILFYGNRRLATRSLQVPHPRVLERKFVLKPLADLAPGFRDPLTGRSMARALRELTAPDQSVRLYRRKI